MDLGLAGRTYLVTGATSGLGRASAQALVDEGARVVISSRDRARVDSAVAELGEQATGLALDNSEAEAPAARRPARSPA